MEKSISTIPPSFLSSHNITINSILRISKVYIGNLNRAFIFPGHEHRSTDHPPLSKFTNQVSHSRLSIHICWKVDSDIIRLFTKCWAFEISNFVTIHILYLQGILTIIHGPVFVCLFVCVCRTTPTVLGQLHPDLLQRINMTPISV